MIKSMTGFGRGNVEVTDSIYDYVIEIKSVNHRYFEFNVKMPRTLISLEDNIRKAVNEKIKRGKVDVFITQNVGVKENVEAVLNEELADSYLKCLKKLIDTHNLRDDISATNLARFPEVVTLSQKEDDLDEIWKVLSLSLNEAIDNLVAMRSKEGEKLNRDIIEKCNIITSDVNKIEERIPEVSKDYRDRLTEKVKEILGDSTLDESRIAMEVVMQADKTAIDEEVVRLKSHVNQMLETIKMDEPVGRKLDFLVQEMNREANTITSKVNDLELTNVALDIKSNIEKIREQVQNVE